MASMALLNLSNRSEKMHSKKNVLVKQWARGCGRSGAVGRDDEMTNFFNISLLRHFSKIIYVYKKSKRHDAVFTPSRSFVRDG